MIETHRKMHASNALNRWLKQDFGLTGHSLRHTFRDRLRAVECPLELIDQIGGWRSITTVGAGYGEGYGVDKINYYFQRMNSALCRRRDIQAI